MSISITLEHLTKTFSKDNAEFNAVEDVHLVIERGELVTFLGPSGCGKTTTLRMVAGFETPTAGRILFDERDVTDMMVNKRSVGFVFQNYALFPHMTVFNNVAFGLRAHHVRELEIMSRVMQYLEMVGLTGTERRFPNQLSGGEQQRVALARVLVMQPKVLLMDEPLSNLDAKLRIQMRKEIRRIQRQLRLTCLYVTHDQKEALTLADRIVVMNGGKVEQVDTPFALYSNPGNLFVADFIGQANVIYGEVANVEQDELTVLIQPTIEVRVRRRAGTSTHLGSRIAIIARPEVIRLGPAGIHGMRGTITNRMFVGDNLDYEVRLTHGEIIHVEERYHHGIDIHNEGETVTASFDSKDAVAIDI